MDVPSHGRSTKVGGRWVVKGRLRGIDGPVGVLGTFTACTLLWPMVFGISGVVDVQRRSIGQQEGSQGALAALGVSNPRV